MSDTQAQQPLFVIADNTPVFRGDIPISSIRVSNKIASPNPTTDMLASVQSMGIIVPLALRDCDDGTFEVIDGIRRFSCAKMLHPQMTPGERAARHIDPVWAVVFPASCTAQEALVIILNKTRSENAVREFVALRSMISTGLQKADIARALQVNEDDLKTRLSLLALSKPLQDAFVSGKIPPDVALAASKLKPSEQTSLEGRLANLADGQKLGKPDIRAVKPAKADAPKQVALDEVHEEIFSGTSAAELSSAEAIEEVWNVAELVRLISTKVAGDLKSQLESVADRLESAHTCLSL